MIQTDKFPQLRHVKRTHGVSVAWLHGASVAQVFQLQDGHTERRAADIFTKHFAPKEKWVQDIFYDHFERMKERCSHLPDWDDCWDRLPEVLKKSTWIEDTESEMKKAGLLDVTVVEQSMRMSALVYGRKPA